MSFASDKISGSMVALTRNVPMVYLAGPIAGLGYDETTDWRNVVTMELHPIKCLSPMRGKEYLQGEKQDVHNHVFMPGYETAMSGPKGIVSRDRFDVARCDLVFMNLVRSNKDTDTLGANKVSIGTMVELGWADAYRKPVVVILDDNNPHIHPFVLEIAGFITTSLEDAIKITKSILF